jgi:hypothetical protein
MMDACAGHAQGLAGGGIFGEFLDGDHLLARSRADTSSAEALAGASVDDANTPAFEITTLCPCDVRHIAKFRNWTTRPRPPTDTSAARGLKCGRLPNPR